MSHRLSDASRLLRGLNQLGRQIGVEATKAKDPRQPSLSIIEPLSELLSATFNQFGKVSISDAASKTTWKSSVLVRQTGIALSNAIRSSPPSTIPMTTLFDEKTPTSSIVTSRTTLMRDKTLIPTYSEIDISQIPITRPAVDEPKITTDLPRDKIPTPSYPKNIPSKAEPIISTKTIDNVVDLKNGKTDNLYASSTKTDSSKVKASVVTTSTVNESRTPLTLEDNEDLMLSAPPTNMDAQARPVPTSRIGRLATFGSLAAGLGVGALGSMVRRSVGLEEAASEKSLSPYLSKANAERIVNTLCKVRGAALKLGQMISIQDNFLVGDEVQKIFERVRQKADFMPEWQMNEAMTNELGADWRSQFEEFQDRPFAAASIGQVHYGVLKETKKRVAVKIQYPGVGKSIESDINNLITLLDFWNIIPRGFYIESVIKVAKRELNWEVDYIREAEWGRRFQYWLKDYPIYRIPDIIDNLSAKSVLTTAFFDGITLDKAVDQDQETRDEIGRAILQLCLLELFKFKAMQTDPNWSNFLYNPSTKTIGLIDFGASRYFNSIFIDHYIKIIRASADNDPERIRDLSVQSGFLTGYETREMTDAHVSAVMILGEAFRTDERFDFGAQSTTQNIHKLIPVMLKHRLTPPPEDSYSLHRKMSGAFLLCTKLRSRVYCKPLFESVWKEYNSS